MTVTVRDLDAGETALLEAVKTQLGQEPRLLPMTAAAFAAYLAAHPSTDPRLADGPPHMAVLRRARAELQGAGFLSQATAEDLKAFLESAPPFAEWEVATTA